MTLAVSAGENRDRLLPSLREALEPFVDPGQHQARLEGVLRQEPTIYQVTEGLKEKAPLVSVARTRAEVASATEQWGKAKQSQIYAKAAQYAETRVFAAGDMIYFIFFDARSIMRDFELVSRER